MYLVYLTSHLDISSVKQWLYVNKKSDALIIDDTTDLVNELLLDTYDLIIFDYKMDFNLIDTLRTLEGKYTSIQVFVANTKIGNAYLSVTENISVLPKALNLMVYLWQHPAFSLGNMLNAEEAQKDVFCVDDFADIDTEKEVLEFKTTIEDLGESDLAEVELLKVEKQELATGLEGDDGADITEFSEGVVDLVTQSLGGLLKRNRQQAEPAVTDAPIDVVEDAVSDIGIETPPDTGIETPPDTVENDIDDVKINETNEIDETAISSENDEQDVNVMGITAHAVKPTSEFTELIDKINKETSIEEVQQPDDIDDLINSILKDKPTNTYEEYDESKDNTYDEIIVSRKAIIEDTVITPQYTNDMQSLMQSSEDTGVVGKSDLGDTATEYHIKPEDKVLYDGRYTTKPVEPAQSDSETKSGKITIKSEPKVLKGVQTPDSQTSTVPKHIGIKTVDTSGEETSPVKRGTLAGLRKRSMKTYRSPYEYFKEKGLDTKSLDAAYTYVQTENLKGNSILLEEELYMRSLIDDDAYILFMKEYLHRQVLTLSELMSSDVILDTWDIATCKQLRLLELPSTQDSKRIAISHRAKAIQTSLLTKYEKLELYVVLDRYIDIRLGEKEG